MGGCGLQAGEGQAAGADRAGPSPSAGVCSPQCTHPEPGLTARDRLRHRGQRPLLFPGRCRPSTSVSIPPSPWGSPFRGQLWGHHLPPSRCLFLPVSLSLCCYPSYPRHTQRALSSHLPGPEPGMPALPGRQAAGRWVRVMGAWEAEGGRGRQGAEDWRAQCSLAGGRTRHLGAQRWAGPEPGFQGLGAVPRRTRVLRVLGRGPGPGDRPRPTAS